MFYKTLLCISPVVLHTNIVTVILQKSLNVKNLLKKVSSIGGIFWQYLKVPVSPCHTKHVVDTKKNLHIETVMSISQLVYQIYNTYVHVALSF